MTRIKYLPEPKFDDKTSHKKYMQEVAVNKHIPVKRIVDGKIVDQIFNRETNKYEDEIISSNVISMKTQKVVIENNPELEEMKKQISAMEEQLNAEKAKTSKDKQEPEGKQEEVTYITNADFGNLSEEDKAKYVKVPTKGYTLKGDK